MERPRNLHALATEVKDIGVRGSTVGLFMVLLRRRLLQLGGGRSRSGVKNPQMPRFLKYNIYYRARIIRWVFWSVVFSVSGGALCLFTKNDGPIPINKNLWSLSYCLVTAGIAMFIQAALYYAVDLKTKWGGRPLYYAGEICIYFELVKSKYKLL